MCKEDEENARYEWLKATINAIDGTIDWTFRVEDCLMDGHDRWTEDVSKWPDDDIRKLTADMLDVEEDQLDVIEICWD